jgi:hypothetical protein
MDKRRLETEFIVLLHYKLNRINLKIFTVEAIIKANSQENYYKISIS